MNPTPPLFSSFIFFIYIFCYALRLFYGYWCFYLHWSRDSVSPVCGIFIFWFLLHDYNCIDFFLLFFRGSFLDAGLLLVVHISEFLDFRSRYNQILLTSFILSPPQDNKSRQYYIKAIFQIYQIYQTHPIYLIFQKKQKKRKNQKST